MIKNLFSGFNCVENGFVLVFRADAVAAYMIVLQTFLFIHPTRNLFALKCRDKHGKIIKELKARNVYRHRINLHAENTD
jgi:hypothetical protein